jgi:hypothetical protein
VSRQIARGHNERLERHELRKVHVPFLGEDDGGNAVSLPGDNLSSHKTDAIEQLVIAAGCKLLFLPAYSPDFSPIEEAFSKLKAFIRRCRCQTLPELMDALEQGLDMITVSDARGWFAHAGFCL